MAKLVFGAGSSHSPILNLPGETWVERAKGDRANPALNLSDGRSLTYAALHAEVGDRYAAEATKEVFRRRSQSCQNAIKRIADDLDAANPDVVIIVGDDQLELFSAANQPAISLFYGDEIVTMPRDDGPQPPQWKRDIRAGYAMDGSYRFPGQRQFALELIEGLIDREFDIATSSNVVDPLKAGFGHAFGFVINRLYGGKPIPSVPLLLNTYFAPNVPSASRCYELGRAIASVIEQSPADLRVAVIASGGLSHFVVDAELDGRVLQGCEPGKGDLLRSIPREALLSGSSEILNWIVVAGAMADMPVAWTVYEPVYRTPAGTGVGAAFLVWGVNA